MFQIEINPNNIFPTKQNFTAIHVFEDHVYKQLQHEQVYWIELHVKDESGSSMFVVLDKEAEKIVRIPATQVYTTEIKV